MAIDRVREYFKTFGIEDKILEFDVSSAIELTIEELEKYSGFDCWIDVCKGW